MKTAFHSPSTQPKVIATEEHQIFSIARPVEGIRASDLFRAGEGGPRALWLDAVKGEQVAGLGRVKRLTAEGPERFIEIQNQVDALARRWTNCSSFESGEQPRLLGGFGFAGEPDGDEFWTPFGVAQFILPAIQLLETEGKAWLVATREGDEDTSASKAQAELNSELDAWITRLLDRLRLSPATAPVVKGAVIGGETEDAWMNAVRDALMLINSGRLEKLVLTRGRDFAVEGQIDAAVVLNLLIATYRDCFVFAFEPEPGHVWLGATPERLAKVLNGNLTTMALAGSARRGKDELEDSQLGLGLLESEKERREHQLVVDDICRNLELVCSAIDVRNGPELRSLPNIQHLQTEISAVLRPEAGILNAVAGLHPTAALCGQPREVAKTELKRLEGVGRGWFGGPIGWLDLAGNGDFSVAIRSAVTAPGRARMYAGAGIVAGSIAEREWEETEMKFLPMAENLFGEIA